MLGAGGVLLGPWAFALAQVFFDEYEKRYGMPAPSDVPSAATDKADEPVQESEAETDPTG